MTLRELYAQVLRLRIEVEKAKLAKLERKK
jgi:hypothetical protein